MPDFKIHPMDKWYEQDEKETPVEERDEVWGSEVLGRFYGNEEFPVEWGSKTEKKIFWVLSDFHNPHPQCALYKSLFGWWDGPVVQACEYMYRRFWAPIGDLWPAKQANGYIYHGVIPPKPDEVQDRVTYYQSIMPKYANEFLDMWENKYLPEIKQNLEYLDEFPYEDSDLHRLLILFEDAIDIFDRHFKIHWILNLAQFQAFNSFKQVYADVFGEVDEQLTDRILNSTDDINWDSLEAMYKLKEYLKEHDEVWEIVNDRESETEEILSKLEEVEGGSEFLNKLDEYLDEFGWKAIYTNAIQYPSWKEDPTGLLEQLRSYYEMDYDYYEDIERTKKDRKEAKEELWERAEEEDISEEMKQKLKDSMEQAIKMAPLTPNHHFYIDQGTHQRMRVVALEIGKKFVEMDILNEKEDILHLTYKQIKKLGTNSEGFDPMPIIEKRKKELEEAEEKVPAPFIGTATEWSLNEEPYKQGVWGWNEDKLERSLKRIEKGLTKDLEEGVIKGVPASPGSAEGVARIVKSPEEFDKVEDGAVMFCDTTNPAWVSVFPKLEAVVTNSGGVLSHPAIVSREFGIPCVVGTETGTHQIEDGQKVKVNGNTGEIEVIE